VYQKMALFNTMNHDDFLKMPLSDPTLVICHYHDSNRKQ